MSTQYTLGEQLAALANQFYEVRKRSFAGVCESALRVVEKEGRIAAGQGKWVVEIPLEKIRV